MFFNEAAFEEDSLDESGPEQKTSAKPRWTDLDSDDDEDFITGVGKMGTAQVRACPGDDDCAE
jgi:hypothetical protein